MKNDAKLLKVKLLGFIFFVASLRPVLACATCYGESDSPLAHGMNWGIMTMIIVVYSVLFSMIAFFIFIARRSSKARNAKVQNENSKLQNDRNDRNGTDDHKVQNDHYEIHKLHKLHEHSSCLKNS